MLVCRSLYQKIKPLYTKQRYLTTDINIHDDRDVSLLLRHPERAAHAEQLFLKKKNFGGRMRMANKDDVICCIKLFKNVKKMIILDINLSEWPLSMFTCDIEHLILYEVKPKYIRGWVTLHPMSFWHVSFWQMNLIFARRVERLLSLQRVSTFLRKFEMRTVVDETGLHTYSGGNTFLN